MLKRTLGFFAIYLLPAMLVIGLFAVGHKFIHGEDDRLTAFKVENGLIILPEEIEPVSEATPIEEQIEVTENGQPIDPALLLPTYRYYQMVESFTGNFDSSGRFYKMELALSVHQSKIKADAIILKLEELETKLRPAIVDALTDISEETLRTADGRNNLMQTLRDAVNGQLINLEEDPVIEAVSITNLVLT